MSEREALREIALRAERATNREQYEMAAAELVRATLAEAAPPSDKRSTWDKEVGWRRVPEAAPPSRRIIMLAPVGADGLCTGCGAKPTRETGRCKCVTGPLTTVHPAEAAPPALDVERQYAVSELIASLHSEVRNMRDFAVQTGERDRAEAYDNVMQIFVRVLTHLSPTAEPAETT